MSAAHRILWALPSSVHTSVRIYASVCMHMNSCAHTHLCVFILSHGFSHIRTWSLRTYTFLFMYLPTSSNSVREGREDGRRHLCVGVRMCRPCAYARVYVCAETPVQTDLPVRV